MSTPQELFDAYLQAVQSLSAEKDFYTFEAQLVKLHNESGRQIMEQQMAKPEETASYKKNSNPVWVSEHQQR